ncbi:TenA family transcriptional regulator [Vulcanisaeta thermophila]|uniref:TenA family transcriptional regulator n=1 Tax=Vulcanisaeta thermophila TaxID=867917 RepID=UPI0008531042|nr:TenA family transcriptional regulator [Vulcanisaeta thermophila]
MDAREFLNNVRGELEPLNNSIINHPLIRDAENGTLSMNAIRAFVVNQWYIVNHDLRSIAIAMSRAKNMQELILMKKFLDGDYGALLELRKLMRELGITEDDPVTVNVAPEAIAYTHYLSWLANYAEPCEFAFVLIVNIPVWGNVVYRLGRALSSKYGIKETGFFDAFKGPFDELEGETLSVISSCLTDNVRVKRMRSMARVVQAYEKMFWDSIYSLR